MDIVRELEGLGLLRGSAAAVAGAEGENSSSPNDLRALCSAGRLQGGLSVAADLRPDELIGPLANAIGGRARRLRVLDAREQPVSELVVELDGKTVHWLVSDISEVVREVNRFFRAESEARAVATLGEWEVMEQLWCIPKERLATLLKQPFFQPRNRAELASLVASGGYDV